MLALIYGSDGCGKSVQTKAIAESIDPSEHWSFAVKNRRLYETSSVPSVELLAFNQDQSVNPYKTIDNLHDIVAKTIKENVLKCIVIDEITLWRTWAQPCAIEWWNRSYTSKITKIGENNALAWEYVNKITYGELERLCNWAEINGVVILAVTSLTDVRVQQQGDDGKLHSVTTGQMVVNAKENIRKLADVRIKLEKDGSKGKGYYMITEKSQGWMIERDDVCKIDKTGLMTELMCRGAL